MAFFKVGLKRNDDASQDFYEIKAEVKKVEAQIKANEKKN